LPPIDPGRIELAADATLAGCERALLTAGGEKLFSALTGQMRTINLSLVSEYEDCYIDHLRLRPMSIQTASAPN